MEMATNEGSHSRQKRQEIRLSKFSYATKITIFKLIQLIVEEQRNR
jgi:hypothetical protein